MAAPSVVDIKVPPAVESNRFREVKFKPAQKVWITIQVVKPCVGHFLTRDFIRSQAWATCSLSNCLKFIMLLLNWIILAGGYYFPIKASLHLSQESMLFLGKDWNQILASPLKEKGKILSLTTSPSTSLYFCISHNSTKLFKCKAAYSQPQKIDS